MVKLVFCLLLAAATLPAADPRQELDHILKILPPSNTRTTGRISAQDRSWEDWVRRTGELPPDFDSMPSIPGLPAIDFTTREAWPREKQRLRGLFEHWFYGKMPPPPTNLRAVVTGTHDENGIAVREVRLEFGPDHRATLRMQVMIPPGKGPFPVFLTNLPRNYPWVFTAVRRGYIGAIYHAGDPVYMEVDDSNPYIELYPDYDFRCLARWAWSGMRAVDYLSTLPEVDKDKIAISGHSRNGKQALLAAAFDERIAAVIPSCGNTGEGNPWRYTSDMYHNESLEQITGEFPEWFQPRLRFFVGREDKLPLDQNHLMALVAPRALYMNSAFAETEGNPFGFEQAYRSVLKIYEKFGAADKLWLDLRDGEHGPTAEDLDRFLDFLDTVFGRKHFPKLETWINGYTFEDWERISGESIDPLQYPRRTPGEYEPERIRRGIRWALGEEPPGLVYPACTRLQGRVHTTDGWMSLLFQRPLTAPGMASTPVGFGDNLKGDLYYPESLAPGRRLPLVVWLHPFSYPTGYSRYTRPTLASLTKRGFAVLAFDQIGFGTRVRDARLFYQRFPHWSLLGKMVVDTRAAIDSATALEIVDPNRVFVVGYALGAKVGLLAAALDKRIQAVAAVAGFDPLRLDTAEKGVEGLRQYSHLHGLAPRFGFFVGQEDRLPLDFDEVLALVAPRNVLVVAPQLDRFARVEDVRREVEQARTAYRNRPEALRLETPLEFSRFPQALQEHVFDWLAGLK